MDIDKENIENIVVTQTREASKQRGILSPKPKESLGKKAHSSKSGSSNDAQLRSYEDKNAQLETENKRLQERVRELEKQLEEQAAEHQREKLKTEPYRVRRIHALYEERETARKELAQVKQKNIVLESEIAHLKSPKVTPPHFVSQITTKTTPHYVHPRHLYADYDREDILPGEC
eukprot:TRINITY_DN2637_c0_g1_i1.p1 TRINITY_DN2637_c0_g1~~TRINITY_DN2637_c0_g1_i1.p1  ORF type:complete len:175 (-),score=38.03 TRINITY_DN2637_c0_g1_i1:191-715(-)